MKESHLTFQGEKCSAEKNGEKHGAWCRGRRGRGESTNCHHQRLSERPISLCSSQHGAACLLQVQHCQCNRCEYVLNTHAPRELLLVDTDLDQTVGVIGMERAHSPLAAVAVSSSNQHLLLLHESGSVSMWAPRPGLTVANTPMLPKSQSQVCLIVLDPIYINFSFEGAAAEITITVGLSVHSCLSCSFRGNSRNQLRVSRRLRPCAAGQKLQGAWPRRQSCLGDRGGLPHH